MQPYLYIIKGIALCESKKREDGIAALQKAQELNDPRAEGLIKKYQYIFNNTILNLL